MIEIIKLLLINILCINFFGFILSILIPAKNERAISKLSLILTGFIALHILILILLYIFDSFKSYSIYLFSLYRDMNYSFQVALIWDTTTIVFLFVGSIITLLIMYFSSYYMHRENGYKRFFNTLLFFYFSYNLIVLSGNFVTLFIGWELLGLSSFLLIAFYRDRYLPVRNAVKVFSVYRIGDMGLIMAIWDLYQLTHDNILFFNINKEDYFLNYFTAYPYVGIGISIGLIVASIGKSAQFPVSYWLPRAMEGPTASSAIFYGSLSVHIGVLLLLRTFFLWKSLWYIRLFVGILGCITYFTANKSAKLQSSIKSQIAYSSISQIGLMYVELSLGLRWLVLVHFISNAFLRTYQLLVSPSVVAYYMRQQVYFSKFIKIQKHFMQLLPTKLFYSLYVIGHNEWNLDYIVNKYLFGTIKKVGRLLKFINERTLLFFVIPLFILSFVGYILKLHFPIAAQKYFSSVFSCISVLLIFRAFAERYRPIFILWLMMMSQLFILISISYNERFSIDLMLLYFSGIFMGFLISIIVLYILKLKESDFFDVNKYYGHIYEHKWLGFIFLIGILSFMGFPITLSFLGEDMILEHIHLNQTLLVFNFSINYILLGITGIKLYARLFLGPHCKRYHEAAIKSA